MPGKDRKGQEGSGGVRRSQEGSEGFRRNQEEQVCVKRAITRLYISSDPLDGSI